MFKFKKYKKKVTSMIIIFIIANTRILFFSICGDFTEMEIIILKVSIFTKLQQYKKLFFLILL